MGGACTRPSPSFASSPTTARDNTPPYPATMTTSTTTPAQPNTAPVEPSTHPSPPNVDYKAVADHIRSLIPDKTQQDGWGPLFVRLAWHSCATYSAQDNSGGSNGAYMRLSFKATDPLHGGLDLARNRLDPVKERFPEVTYADLYVLCGVVAVKELGGPSIPWRAGRKDIQLGDQVHKDQEGRFPLPEDTKETMFSKFARMGLTKRDMVALMGGHCLGRGHMERSGYDGPWIDDPTEFSNEYYVELLEDEWKEATLSNGIKQFEAYPEGEKLMMLPTDMYLLRDPELRGICEEYAGDQEKFFGDFAGAFRKLMESGVEFPEGAEVYRF
ncbi:hypothetical protein HDV00_001491 [Rhizophlyctis rosea]|nr:hypothetical protein HDV00_001491 [Rhizophlyctis rosea]